MPETSEFSFCKSCSALTINDQILDDVLEDLPSEVKSQHALEIEYTKTDTLPDLPELASTANAGCPFCEFWLAFVSDLSMQCLENLDKSGSFKEQDPESSKLSVTITNIRYFKDEDSAATGFTSHQTPTTLTGLAADVTVYYNTSRETIFKDTLWFPLRANDGRSIHCIDNCYISRRVDPYLFSLLSYTKSMDEHKKNFLPATI
jgi:hypothetical protein